MHYDTLEPMETPLARILRVLNETAGLWVNRVGVCWTLLTVIAVKLSGSTITTLKDLEEAYHTNGITFGDYTLATYGCATLILLCLIIVAIFADRVLSTKEP
jgi:hypothetical protein